MKNLQRLRSSSFIRELTAETTFGRSQLIQPLFVVEGLSGREPIPGLHGNFRMSRAETLKQIELDLEAGVTQFIFFFVPAKKRESGFDDSFAAAVLGDVKGRFGKDAFFWVDTCLCSKTQSGHCCLFNDLGEIDYEQTHKALGEFAVICAQAGAGGIAPSDMIDGRVEWIRKSLDTAGKISTPIMSYSTKFASAFYGPFREAADSTPQFGDRKSYQLDVRNRSAAIAASNRCAEEGADLLMVKPGMTSIDLIADIKQSTGLPVGAYQVSGEYAGLTLLSDNGLINFQGALIESWQVFRRAGASFVITYGARLARSLGM